MKAVSNAVFLSPGTRLCSRSFCLLIKNLKCIDYYHCSAKLEQPTYKQQRQREAFCLSASLTVASYMCLLAEDAAVRAILDRNMNQLLCFFAEGHHLKVNDILFVVFLFCFVFLADLTSRQLFHERGV